jgi:phospholipase C
VTSSPGGINCGTICSVSFSSDTLVQLTPTPSPGSAFAGWSGACSGAGSCQVILNSAQSVTAIFNLMGFTLTVDSSGSGSGIVTSSPAGVNCQTTCSASFTSGTTVQLTAIPNQGSTFHGWGGACSGTGTCHVTIDSTQSVAAIFNVNTFMLSVNSSGSGSGIVTSFPAGIDCGTTCSASFGSGTTVQLNAVPNQGSTFQGWSGACSGTGLCQVPTTSNQTVGTIFSAVQNIKAINHIVFMAQENRSFDHYFGALREYWAQNGYADQQFDGLPQFAIPSGSAPSNPGCDPTLPPPNQCLFDPNNPLTSYHLQTMCLENTSPTWNEAHVDVDYNHPTTSSPSSPLDGFVWTAAHDARNLGFVNDVNGKRAIGYYDGSDLNYYYFMASNFATSDRWFSPVMTRTSPNRMYLLGGTSQGHVYPLQSPQPQLSGPMIFQLLQQNGISWRIYVHADASGCTTASCLYAMSYIQNFSYGNTILHQFPQNIVPTSQFITDAQNGSLPQVALVEPPSNVGLDEHPANDDSVPCCSVQAGANFVSSLINALMTGPSWKDSAFILTWDEYGGFYDHVPPQPTVSPDGIKPSDLLSGDVCTTVIGPTCDFTYTGLRVPLIVVSPFTKKHYVSHTIADYTAILKFIETRFNLPSLTGRDATQMDMTEFFDFVNQPWMTPPSPPTQDRTKPCYLDQLP